MNIQNAKITSTQLGTTDRGISFWLNLEFGNSGQGFGGINLRNAPISLLIDLMHSVGVNYWEQLPNTYVRIQGNDARLTAIGHIVEDKWFSLDKI